MICWLCESSRLFRSWILNTRGSWRICYWRWAQSKARKISATLTTCCYAKNLNFDCVFRSILRFRIDELRIAHHEFWYPIKTEWLHEPFSGEPMTDRWPWHTIFTHGTHPIPPTHFFRVVMHCRQFLPIPICTTAHISHTLFRLVRQANPSPFGPSTSIPPM